MQQAISTVVDEKGHRVLKYSAGGKFLRAFGEYGDAAGQFIAPFKIAALTDGTLLVGGYGEILKGFRLYASKSA